MLAAQYGTVGDIEIMWVVCASIGFILATWNFIDATRDVSALKVIPTGANGRMTLARAQQAQDGIRMMIHAIFILIGALAMTIPDNSDPDPSSTSFWLGLAIRWGLLTGAVLLVIQSLIARFVRYRVIDQAKYQLLHEHRAAAAAASTED